MRVSTSNISEQQTLTQLQLLPARSRLQSSFQLAVCSATIKASMVTSANEIRMEQPGVAYPALNGSTSYVEHVLLPDNKGPDIFPGNIAQISHNLSWLDFHFQRKYSVMRSMNWSGLGADLSRSERKERIQREPRHLRLLP
jgi:hypothetical protein